jgi:hypothetical protein
MIGIAVIAATRLQIGYTMATQANRMRTTRGRKLAGAALLCGLVAICAALVLAVMALPARSPETATQPPVVCIAARTRPAWPPAQRLQPAGPRLPCPALRWTRTDLESAERELQAVRRT